MQLSLLTASNKTVIKRNGNNGYNTNGHETFMESFGLEPVSTCDNMQNFEHWDNHAEINNEFAGDIHLDWYNMWMGSI